MTDSDKTADNAGTSAQDDALEKVTQQQLDVLLAKHKKYLNGVTGGLRITLKFKDLSNLDFRKMDLSQADFTGSILKDAK